MFQGSCDQAVVCCVSQVPVWETQPLAKARRRPGGFGCGAGLQRRLAQRQLQLLVLLYPAAGVQQEKLCWAAMLAQSVAALSMSRLSAGSCTQTW